MRFRKEIFWLTLFSIAMGYLESAVVVYLRQILYPSGFAFPLAQMSQKIATTEIFREIATILMLISVAFLVGKNTRQKLAWFIYCFAVWDIFYYAFLKLLLHWPESLFTWDILFLIPVMWTGPVLAPIIISITMILMAVFILQFGEKVNKIGFSRFSRILIATGSIFVFLSFIWDFSSFLLKHYSLKEVFKIDMANAVIGQYIPAEFNWFLFTVGEVALLAALYSLVSSYRKVYTL